TTDKPRTAQAFMYLSTLSYGPDEESKTVHQAIDADIDGFRQRFKKGQVEREEDLNLPRAKTQALVYTFLSGEARNAYERIAYIPEANRVLVAALSAKTDKAFVDAAPDFRAFVQSYGGSIGTTVSPSSPSDKPQP